MELKEEFERKFEKDIETFKNNINNENINNKKK